MSGGEPQRMERAQALQIGAEEGGKLPSLDGRAVSTIETDSVRRATVAVLEGQRFIRECILRGLSGVLPLQFVPFASLSALEAFVDASRFQLVILSWMRSEATREDKLDTLRRVRSALPGAGVVVLASGQDLELGRLALSEGARGYIPMSTGFEIAIEALRFVLMGGTFAPPEILLGARGSFSPGAHAPTTNAVTAREMLVIRAIQQGKPNKVIAYELGMCESTVKIHVRHVMKKLGAKNRTDLAIKAWEALKKQG